MLKFSILGLIKILLITPESVWIVLISFADEIGISADLKNVVKSFSSLQEKKNTKKHEMIYFKFYRFGTLIDLFIQQDISITSPSLPDEKISAFCGAFAS